MRIPFRFETVRSHAVARADTVANHTVACHDTGCVDAGVRDCGDCHACCIHLPIPAGEADVTAKPAGMVCPHLAIGGCQIYQGRPVTCRQFHCVWLTEPTWPLAWRPELSGLLCLREEIDQGVSAALVYEIEGDAITRSTTEAILTSLKDSTAIVALVNVQQQRRLLRGRQWAEEAEHRVRRPHFLWPIHAVDGPQPKELRDAS